MKNRLERRFENCDINNNTFYDDWNVKYGPADYEIAYANAHHDYGTYNNDNIIKNDDKNAQHATPTRQKRTNTAMPTT